MKDVFGRVLETEELRGVVMYQGAETTLIHIVKGQDKTISCRLSRANGDHFDLSDADRINARFTRDDGKAIEISLKDKEIMIDAAAQGRITLLLSQEKSAQLKRGDRLSFEVEVIFELDKSDNPELETIIVKMPSVLWVRDRIGS